jgi:hypothetical protein
VLVVVVAVSGVPAPVVNVVNVIAVRNGHMATAVAVNMPMLRVHLVLGRRLTFVVVVGVSSMQVTVVHVVDVIPVRHRDMPAAFAVGVGVIGMLFVSCIGHRCIAAVRCYSKRISLSDASTRPEPQISARIAHTASTAELAPILGEPRLRGTRPATCAAMHTIALVSRTAPIVSVK